MLRLQKIISEAGIASRHKAEELIKNGFVTVNGLKINQLGTKADPAKDQISVNGKLINPRPIRKIYLLMNKPKGFVTTANDPQNRPIVIDLLKKKEKIFQPFPVGRLDYNTEGAILLTNDGNLANCLMHPRYKISRTYLLKIKGDFSDKDLRKIETGMILENKKTLPAKIIKDSFTGKHAWYKLILFEGRNKQIKNMCFNLGHPLIKLKRIKYAFLDLKHLQPGEYRHLTIKEIDTLKKIVQKT